MKPKEVFPTSSEIKENQEYWNKRSITYRDEKRYFDQVVRTDECYFCKKEDRKQRSEKTLLHHLKYDDSHPLAWTLEICTSCHYRVDKNAKKIIDRQYANKRKKETVERIMPFGIMQD